LGFFEQLNLKQEESMSLDMRVSSV